MEIVASLPYPEDHLRWKDRPAPIITIHTPIIASGSRKMVRSCAGRMQNGKTQEMICFHATATKQLLNTTFLASTRPVS